MQLFADYIEPVTSWLQYHPQHALFITALIAFLESLAIIGSIIPGSLTMTAIGIMAGSGIMRIDLTFIAASVGAILGDSLSYFLGSRYRLQLPYIWPFSRHPKWLTIGQDYFIRHGGKSVLLGRFFGPLRSIIPLIAGMLHMNHWRFLIANVLSAIGWSFLYLTPGILIGAASNDLSPDSATRLFVLVLIVLAAMWLFSLLIRWAFVNLHYFLPIHCHNFWVWMRGIRLFRPLNHALTPPNETNHPVSASLFLGFVFCIISFITLGVFVKYGYFQTGLNEPIYLFLQSVRIDTFDTLFIWARHLINPVTLSILASFLLILNCYLRHWQNVLYWININLTCLLLSLLTYVGLTGYIPSQYANVAIGHYPDFLLMWATTQYLSILLYLHYQKKHESTGKIAIFIIMLLMITGFASLYLGNNTLTDILGAYLAGMGIVCFYAILYRRRALLSEKPLVITPKRGLRMLLIVILQPTIFFGVMHHNIQYPPQVTHATTLVLADATWWQQTQKLLPLYRMSRIGKPVALFNVQYAGTLLSLENALIQQGWRNKNDSFFTSLLKRISGEHTAQDNPLLAPLYLNRKPTLIMDYQSPEGGLPHILRLWQSNAHLLSTRQPIWIGTVNTYSFTTHASSSSLTSVRLLLQTLPQFQSRLIPVTLTQTLHTPTAPILLLLQDNPG